MVERHDRLPTAYEDRVRGLSEAIRRRERELLILSQVAARVHGEDEVQAIFDIALEEILTRMGLTAAWIFTGDENDQKLRLTASRGVSATYLDSIRKDGLEECLCPEVFWSGHRMQARNTLQCPRMPHIVEGLHAPVAHACIPLKFEGHTRGVLNVAARAGQVFSEDELRFLDTLGHQIGIAVERARVRETERRRDQESRAMAAISKAVGGSLDVQAVLEAVGRTAREILAGERSLILLGTDPRRMQVAQISGHPHPELKVGQSLDLVAVHADLLRRVIEERETFAMDDSATDPLINRELARRWGTGSGMATPLLGRDRILGLLYVTRGLPHHWTEQNVEIGEALAAQAAVALENARLYEESRRAYQELKGAQERIISAEKMAMLGTFASGLAHEVRNPLNSIGLQLSILERRIGRCEASLGQQMTDVTRVIREEIRRLDALVGDFLLFSRTSRPPGRGADLEGLVREVLTLLGPEAERAGVTLHSARVGPPPGPLPADGERLKQVVINLVRNAIEAMVEGGRVTVESGLDDGRVRLAVRDTGPGLPEGLDVFQLFVTTKPRGTGLGLSIVQQIVVEHGGEISADSAPGEGTVFTIHLPAGAPMVQEVRT